MPNIVHIMREWEYTFDQVSKEEWIRQIETDLRQKPLDSTYSEWWPGAPLTPFVHEDDIQDEIVRLPDFLFAQPPTIAEWIGTESLTSDTVNQQIVDALQYGAQSIILQADDFDKTMLSKWLKDVRMEMISVSLQVPSIQLTNLYSILGNDGIPVFIRMERNELSPSILSLIGSLEDRTNQIEWIRFIYRFPSTGLWDLTTIATFKGLLDDLAIWKSYGLPPTAFFSQCILVLEADVAYFKHILQTRVLHLLWQNLIAPYDPESPENNSQYLECHIIPHSNEQPDQFLIRASMSSLAASLCGTSTLCIHPSAQGISPTFYKRINRNIHHLLELESGIYKGTDPLAGAYAIDFHSKQLTERIWRKLF